MYDKNCIEILQFTSTDEKCRCVDFVDIKDIETDTLD